MDLLTRRVIFLVFTLAVVGLFFYAGAHLTRSKMFSPGPLSSAHMELDKNGECKACHTKGKRLDNSKCLDCHQKIGNKIQAKSGFHARAGMECTLCHSEHHGRSYNISQLDVKTFEHATTGWAIDGKHALLKCQACHTKGRTYLLDKKDCIHCHQDIHKGENGEECSECHTPKDFKETK